MPVFSSASSSRRSEQFRSAHDVGEVIRGEVLSYVDASRAWVRMGQLVVLASIRAGLHAGTRLLFRVHALYPEIILKEIHPAGEARAALQTCIALRQEFETCCEREYGPHWAAHLPSGMQQPTVSSLYAQLDHAVQAINALLSGQKIAYRPAILAGLQNSILIYTPALSGTAIAELLGHGFLPTTQHSVWIQTCFTKHQSRTMCFVPPEHFRARQFLRCEVRDSSAFPLRSPWERLELHGTPSSFEATI